MTPNPPIPNVENLNRLIAQLRMLPPERFHMRAYFSRAGTDGEFHDPDRASIDDCGTAACLAGWCSLVRGSGWMGSGHEADYLGLNSRQAAELFYPWHALGMTLEADEPRPLQRAIDVLCYLRDTGEVRWDLFPPENDTGKPPSAPQVTEFAQPILPEAIRTLLDAPTEPVEA